MIVHVDILYYSTYHAYMYHIIYTTTNRNRSDSDAGPNRNRGCRNGSVARLLDAGVDIKISVRCYDTAQQ